ncbi:MAG: spermidine synthase [Halobacteriaceae archaeon]
MGTRTWRPSLSNAELAVLMAGVTSIGIEILAGRIVAPEFGNSIYVWGSIIGVNLAALAAGYHLAGRRAPTRANTDRIASLLLQAGVFVVVLLVGGDAILKTFDALPLPARFAPLPAITFLFGPPVFLLGFVSPYAAELSEEPTAGSASGRVYALGTIGSIIGAFGTTFFLVPTFPIAVIEVGFGLLLAGTALWVGETTPTRVGQGLVLVVALLAAFLLGGYGLQVGGTTIYQTGTPYANLQVVDENGVRTLYLGGAPQSAMYIDGREGYVFDYSAYLHIPMLVQSDVDRVLFIGGGGFSTPKRYLEEYPNVTVDVVELDPVVIDVARQYFNVSRSERLNVIQGDGREFLEETNREYDVIVLDAYRQDRVPYHMTTVEFFRLAKDRLDSDGALVANVISARSGSGSEFFRAEFKTLQQAFPHVYAFPTSETPLLQNIELVALKQAEGFTEAEFRQLARDRRAAVGLNLTTEVSNYLNATDVPTGDVPILTDEYAPVDRLLDPQLGRRYVIERNNSSRTLGPLVTPTWRAGAPSVTAH